MPKKNKKKSNMNYLLSSPKESPSESATTASTCTAANSSASFQKNSRERPDQTDNASEKSATFTDSDGDRENFPQGKGTQEQGLTSSQSNSSFSMKRTYSIGDEVPPVFNNVNTLVKKKVSFIVVTNFFALGISL
jgi:hypothetical protein